MEENQVVSMPRIGDKAPEFKAVTTQGNINFPADYAGGWVILFSHPADFTNGKDHSTHQMAVTILNEELEHENDIEDWINDINRMKEEFKKIRM